MNTQTRDWQRLLYAATGLTALVYLYLAFFRPLTLTIDPLSIQDDVRDFLLWGARITDPGALKGDYMADYWQSVSPPIFRWLFSAGAALGIRPIDLAKLLPVPLLFMCAALGWRIAMIMTDRRPRAAFFAAAFLVGLIIHEDSIFSGTPRGFSPALLLLLFYGIVAKRDLLSVIAVVALAAIYPASAIVGVTMFAFSKIRSVWPPRLESWKAVLIVGGTGLLMAAVVMPFVMHADPWGPTLTLKQALTMPNMMSVTGRTTIVDPNGGIGWICSSRMGYFPAIISCGGDVPAAYLLDIPLAIPMVVLGFRALRKPAGDPHRLYLIAFAATLLWYAIAIIVAFKLHLPSRYSQRVLEVMEGLAIGQMLGMWLDARVDGEKRGVRIAYVATFVVLTLSFLSPIIDVRRPADRELIAHIRTLPSDARIGGVSDELEFIPALTGRSVLGAAEQAVPYQLGYFNQVLPRLRASLVMVSTHDPEELRQAVSSYDVDYILAERSMLSSGKITGRFPTVLPAESEAAGRNLQRGTPAFLAAGRRCVEYAGENLLLVKAACAVQASPTPVLTR